MFNPFGQKHPFRSLRLEVLESRDLLSASSPLAQPLLAAVPDGANGTAPYTPSQISAAYGFNQIAFTGSNGQSIKGDGTGETIAIVDAYSSPTAAADLATFSKSFGLPTANLTVATPEGTPAVNTLWTEEISLDVEWAHAMAPKANILLVEAKSSSLTDLLNAVSYAADQPGVSVVSMNWGAGEFSSEKSLDSYFKTPAGHSNVSFVASAGDAGAANGPSWPSISPNVLSVGGTSLTLTSSGAYGSESAWSDGGGGYSKYEPKPTYQDGVQTSSMRTDPDVAYDANPNTGYYVYDTEAGGWLVLGGTSAGAPQWGALVAIADQGRALAGNAPLANVQGDVYALPASDFHDITTGSNGYSAHAGYDLATGLGSPYANKVVSGLLTAEAPPASTSTNGFSGLNWSGWTLPSTRSSALIAAGPGKQASYLAFAGPVSSPGGPAAIDSNSTGSVFYCFSDSNWQQMVETTWGYRPNTRP